MRRWPGEKERAAVQGLMTDRQLLVQRLLWRAEKVFPSKEVLCRESGGCHSYTYAEYGVRARKLAQALRGLGVQAGDRIGTLAWNTHRHFEAYFAVPCVGAVLHTFILRLFTAHIRYIINHAADSVLLLDPDQIPLVESIAAELGSVRAYVIMADELPATTLHPAFGYEELLAPHDGDLEWPEFDENTAAGLWPARARSPPAGRPRRAASPPGWTTT